MISDFFEWIVDIVLGIGVLLLLVLLIYILIFIYSEPVLSFLPVFLVVIIGIIREEYNNTDFTTPAHLYNIFISSIIITSVIIVSILVIGFALGLLGDVFDGGAGGNCGRASPQFC